MAISALNALTLSPALCADRSCRPPKPARGPFRWFNSGLDVTRNGYSSVTRFLARRSIVAGLIIVLARQALAYWLFTQHADRLHPHRGPGRAVRQRPAAGRRLAAAHAGGAGQGAGRSRAGTEGVANVVTVSGYSILTGAIQPNSGFVLVVMKPWDERTTPRDRPARHLHQAQHSDFAAIDAANLIVFPPPAIPGIGNAEGFDFRLQALGGQSPDDLAQVDALLHRGGQFRSAHRTRLSRPSRPKCPASISTSTACSAQRLNVPVSTIFSTLQAQLGSSYVNNFNILGQTYQVNVAADAQYRAEGRRYPAASMSAAIPAPWCRCGRWRPCAPTCSRRCSTATTSSPRRRSTARRRPAYRRARRWQALTEARRQGAAGGLRLRMVRPVLSGSAGEQRRRIVVFGLAIVFGYLFLVAQYESWTIPFAVITSVVVAVLGAIVGIQTIGARPQCLRADRPGAADRPGGEERDPDRRIRQGEPRVRQEHRSDAAVEGGTCVSAPC